MATSFFSQLSCSYEGYDDDEGEKMVLVLWLFRKNMVRGAGSRGMHIREVALGLSACGHEDANTVSAIEGCIADTLPNVCGGVRAQRSEACACGCYAGR